MIIFNQLHLSVVGILVVYLLALVNSSGLSVRISPRQLTQYRGQHVVFRCYVTGNPVPIVSWFIKGTDITRHGRLKTSKIPGGYMMRLGPVHPVLDNGTIECRGKNSVDPPVADKADLHVLREVFRASNPNVPPGIPKPLARYSPRLPVNVGTSLTLVVNVSGNPIPNITWFKDEKLLDWNNPRFSLLNNNSLRITNAQVADRGKYDYMAENNKGQIFSRVWTVSVDHIRTKPGFRPGLNSQVVNPETDVMLNCSATGHPKPYVHWENSNHQRVEEGGFLVIKNVRKYETYTCIAKNTLGNATISVNVTLSGLPFAPKNVMEKSKKGHTLTISWQDGEAGTKIDYHSINYRKKGSLYWKTVYHMQENSREYALDHLDAYTDYEVQVFAWNKLGTSKGSKIIMMTTDETAPGSAPRSIVVKSTETGSFQVSWLPPEYPNGNIVYYTIHYSDDLDKPLGDWYHKYASDSPEKVSDQIQNDKRYVVRISSTGVAAGPKSKPFLVQTLQGAPSDPQNVQTKVLSATEVELTWEKPSYEGSGQGIVGYDIYYYTSLDGGRRKLTIQSPDDFSKVVTGLKPASIYKFNVAARTDAGSGPLSFPQLATTWESAPSAAPTNLSCTALDESRIRCSWRPPPFKHRNGLIIGYEIRYQLSKKDTYFKISFNNSVLSITLDNLQAYAEYHIDIAAESSRGRGPFSSRVLVLTDETTPSKPPENMTATAVNDTAIYVTWKAPSPPFGARLTGYLIFYRLHPQDTEEYTPIVIVGNKRRKLFTGLDPEQEYEFRIAAESAKGRGKFTKPVFCKTRQAPPLPPIFYRLKKLAAPQVGVALNWKSNARAIEQFKLRYAKEVEKITNDTLLNTLKFVEKTFPPSVTAHNASNLDPGLWYVFKISVKNLGGWSMERRAWYLMDAAKPTGSPLGFRVIAKTSTSVQLSWDLPEKWKRNGKIIGYELSYQQVGTSGKKIIDRLGDKRMLKVQGLKKFTSYQFWILAKTVAGNGPAVMIKETTNEDVPSDPPTLLEAKGMGKKVVRLKFNPPLTPNGHIIGYKAKIYLSDPTYADEWKEHSMSEGETEMYVGKLPNSNTRYWFTMAAVTSVGPGPFSKPLSAKTLIYDLPLPVQKLSVDDTSSSTLKLQWESPADTAVLHSYKISYRGEKRFIGHDKKLNEFDLPEEVKTVDCCTLNSATLENLEANTHYTVSIVSMSTSQKISESKELKVKTKVASSPIFRQPNISKNDITDEYIPIYVHPASERYGPISYYLIYVASLGTNLSKAKKKLREISPSRSRRAINTNERDDVHIAGKLNASVVPTTFKVGRGQIYNDYTNKRLKLGHFYSFSIQSCVLNENSHCLKTSTAFTDPVEFSAVKNDRTSGAGNEDSGNNLWLLGPVGGVLALIIIICVLCFVWRRRGRRKERKPKSLKEMVHDEQLPMMTSPTDPVEMQRLNLETEGMRDHPPIHISQLGRHIEHLRSNNNNSFTREYESIDPGMTFISETSAHHLNQSKNRYPNIVPYDHTRVVLQDTNGFLDSDYINANYMAGYRKPHAYIATQAPLTNTINDFWQMVWEQNTRTIVMMTNLQEKSRIKCDQYWPHQSSEKFGNITVVLVETIELAHYTVRTFRLYKDGQTDKAREIKQYQYTAWPDHGVPHYSTSLLCFIRKVRLANPSDVGPVVVHCSAGVGRTGVFIVIDSMLERIRREQTVDVYGHVTLLRSQRNHMVQTEEQYIFIHETMLEAVLFGNTEIHASDLTQYYKKLNEINEKETTSIEEHFKQLSEFSHTHRFVTAVLAVNKSKNRYPKTLPYEHSRVDLVPVRGVDGSNYINASYIDGYKQRRTYIAAQGPLEETVNDFWRMVMEKKSNIIVMLSGTDDNDQKMSAKYWPSEQSAKYHFYIVDPVSVEETPNFTLRQFKVNDMMSSCPSLIKLFHLRKWPDRGKPQSYKAILDLIGQVHTARNNDEARGPVVVHCGSGSGRTGVFCALSIVLERMRCEGVVDLLQTVRQLREQRPQMVETLEQYAFCYEAALQYLSSFDHITA